MARIKCPECRHSESDGRPHDKETYHEVCTTCEGKARRERVNMQEEFTLRMLGDNVTLMRCAWMELLEELRPDSELAQRIRTMLEPEQEPPTGCFYCLERIAGRTRSPCPSHGCEWEAAA